MARRILVVLSEFGYWGEELVGPLSCFDENGYSVVFATPTGKQPHALPPSMDPDYLDPPLGRSVTSPEVSWTDIRRPARGCSQDTPGLVHRLPPGLTRPPGPRSRPGTGRCGCTSPAPRAYKL